MEETKDNANGKVIPFASEMYSDLKQSNKYKEKIIKWLFIVIVILIVALVATNVYHIYEWSQYDTVVVDSSSGNGCANYVNGDNTGGIYNNGENSSTQEESYQQEEVKGNTH